MNQNLESMKETGDENEMISPGSKNMVDIMLLKFIEHHQLFEFIEVYKVYLDKTMVPSALALGN